MNLFHKKHEDGTAYSKEEMQAYRAEKAARKTEAVQREKTDWEKEEEARKLRNANYYSVLAQAKKEKKEEHVAPENAFLSCCHINKIYANRVQAVSDFNLDVKEGEFLVLVGPSGCGKSTTLRMIAGLEDITSGELFIDGRYVNKVEPKKRRVAMVFQSYALYPHMSVYENMAFGLEGTKEERMGEDGKMHEVRLSKSEIHDRVQKASEALQIVEYLDRKPTQLSGGQCQRVALGRAYVRNAKIFLLDEPLSNLDAKLRVQMRSELVRLHQNLSNTMVYVTHDQTEAMTMADRIVVMKLGQIQQIGTPRQIYDHPANVFVATFIGNPSMNIIKARYQDGVLSIGDFVYPLTEEQIQLHDQFYQTRVEEKKKQRDAIASNLAELVDSKSKISKHSLEVSLAALEEDIHHSESVLESKEHDIYFGIRPEDIGYHVEEKDGKHLLEMTVQTSELLGADYILHFLWNGNKVEAKCPADRKMQSGSKIQVRFKESKIHLFDDKSEDAIF